MVKRIGCGKCNRCRTILLIDELLDMTLWDRYNPECGPWEDEIDVLKEKFTKLAQDVAVMPCES